VSRRLKPPGKDTLAAGRALGLRSAGEHACSRPPFPASCCALLPLAVLVPVALCCLAVRRVNHGTQAQPAATLVRDPEAVA